MGGGNPSKKLINGGGGSEISKKRGFTLSKITLYSTVFERKHSNYFMSTLQ